MAPNELVKLASHWYCVKPEGSASLAKKICKFSVQINVKWGVCLVIEIYSNFKEILKIRLRSHLVPRTFAPRSPPNFVVYKTQKGTVKNCLEAHYLEFCHRLNVWP